MDNAVKEKKHRHITPSVKQVKALQLLNSGMSKRQAMIQAGYSVSTATHSSQQLTRSRAVVEMVESMKGELLNLGVTEKVMAEKIKTWLTAQKKDKDDYKTQQTAYKFWKDVMEPTVPKQGLKRKVTFEEFLGEEEKGDEL